MKQGTKITYTMANLAGWFTQGAALDYDAGDGDVTVNAGDTGTYHDSGVGLPPGWHWTTVNHEGTTVYVPAHTDMFKVATT